MSRRGPSDAVLRQLGRLCKDCDKPVLHRGGQIRCEAHAKIHLAKEIKRRAKLKSEGRCRCNKPAFPGMPRCFKCAFRIEQEKVEDWVRLLETNPRLFDRMLRVLGGG